jgi:hypothetical protein
MPSVFIFSTKDEVARTLLSYDLKTANDAMNRDPVSWRLSGVESSTGPWTLLDEVTDFNPPVLRGKSYSAQNLSAGNELFDVPFTVDDPCDSTAAATRTAGRGGAEYKLDAVDPYIVI